jgi:hypothetical protein
VLQKRILNDNLKNKFLPLEFDSYVLPVSQYYNGKGYKIYRVFNELGHKAATELKMNYVKFQDYLNTIS